MSKTSNMIKRIGSMHTVRWSDEHVKQTRTGAWRWHKVQAKLNKVRQPYSRFDCNSFDFDYVFE